MSDQIPTNPNQTTDAAEQDPVVIESTPNVRQHARGNRITIDIPEEVIAVARLTNRQPAEVIMDLMQAQMAAIRTRAKGLLGEVVL